MMSQSEIDGYNAAKRFLRDFPAWFRILKASLHEAVRCDGEFAGAWVLAEAKKEGIDWFPNLRTLVSHGILEKTDVARGGRRAYYVMKDVAGVKRALAEFPKNL